MTLRAPRAVIPEERSGEGSLPNYGFLLASSQ
jgi:hypothetical protein